MFYIIQGNDFDKKKATQTSLLQALLKKRPDAEVFEIEENYDAANLDELLFSQGLFENKFIVTGKRIFSSDMQDIFLQKVKDLGASPNVFLFLEDALPKTVLKKIEKYAEQIFEFSQVKKGAEPFNRFLLAEALGARDKKHLWVLYQKALKENIPIEEIHGMLFWQLKAISFAKVSKTAAEAGMKSYPFQKAQRYAGNFSESELDRKRGEFVSLYHEAHRGNIDFSEALESFILNL